jgi:hypothetical protein
VSFDTTKLANAPYTFRVDAVATDGSTASASATATVSNPIVTPLSVRQSLADGQNVSGTLAWTATPSGKTVSRVEFSANGQVVGSDSTAPYELAFDTTRLANGTYPFAVKAFATDGSTASTSALVNVANTVAPPTTSSFSVVQNVSDGQSIAGSYAWNARPSGKGVTKVNFSIDGRKVATKPQSPYETAVDTTRQSDGKHAFRVDAVASDGSVASATAYVLVANQTPRAMIAVTQSLRDGQRLSGSVPWTATTSGESASRVEFYVDSKLAWAESRAPYVFGGDGNELDTTTLADGSHALLVVAYGTSTSARAAVTISVSNGKKAGTSPSATTDATAPQSSTSSKTSSGNAASGNSSSANNSSGSTSGNSSSGTPSSDAGNGSQKGSGPQPDSKSGDSSDHGNGSHGNRDSQDSSVVDSSIQDGETISGAVTWAVAAHGADFAKVEFYVDSKLMWTEQRAPFVYGGRPKQFDAASLTPGAHVLEVRAIRQDGSVLTLTLHVTVT